MITMDNEPTMAADAADETQSIYAWSQADDATEPAAYVAPRGWRLPAAAATLAFTAVAAGIVIAWPHTHEDAHPLPAPPTAAAPTTQQSPPPPPKPQTPDERFLALLEQRNVVVVSPPLAINGAHETCTDLAKGYSAREIAEADMRSTPGTDLRTESAFVATAQEVYCPPGT